MLDKRVQFLFLLFLLILSFCVLGLGRKIWAETGSVQIYHERKSEPTEGTQRCAFFRQHQLPCRGLSRVR